MDPHYPAFNKINIFFSNKLLKENNSHVLFINYDNIFKVWLDDFKAKYFFVRHYHNSGDLDLQYCPTEQMWADVLTKPLQGAKFCLMRAFLMNCSVDYQEDPPPSPLPTLPMKQRSLRPTPSSRGCVETKSHGTKVPSHSRAYEYAPKHVTWKATSTANIGSSPRTTK